MRQETKEEKQHLGYLSKVGFPMGFEYSISALGAVVMKGFLNPLGTVAVAGQTAGEKIRQMFTLPMESVGMAMAIYAGQKKYLTRHGLQYPCGFKRCGRVDWQKLRRLAGLLSSWFYRYLPLSPVDFLSISYSWNPFKIVL